jgi:zinc transport system ATP-binding protein
MLASDDYILNVTHLNLKIQNQIILSNISFKLKRGTTLAIVGPNGAGKSMLFKTLLNLVPYEGKIDWEGKITMGYVPQLLSVKDIPISVREFLSIKKSSDLEHYLSLVGLSKEILDKSLSILSGGQLRRVLIAWAVLDKPNVLLFDEPTTGVDLDSEEAIYRMLRKLTKENGVTLLLISHDLHIVREYSDYVLALNKCVTFFGESKQIMDLSLQETIFGEPVCMETP